jgi:MerR family mercuric resistance operon transcriptional regulator
VVQSQDPDSLTIGGLTIGGLARAGGVGIETIRYYQRRGLMPEPARDGNAVRRYDGAYLQKLRFIRSAQIAGFTLKEIRELLALDATRDRARARKMAQTRIAALNTQIADLTAARDALRTLAKACGARKKGPCPIIGAFGT